MKTFGCNHIVLYIFLAMIIVSTTCLAADIVEHEVWSFDGEQTESNLGCAVASAGDVNGDGYDDIIVGASGFDNDEEGAGKGYLFYGSSEGPAAEADWHQEGVNRYHTFGESVSCAGDVNNDGYDDVVVGAWNYDQVFVYYGSELGLSDSSNWSADFGADSREWFGWSVSTAGDVNGDGYDDIIVGMPSYGNGQSGEGRVLVFHGSENGLNATPNWTFELDQQDARLGYSVSTAGDVNNDGYSDVIVGAYNQGVFDSTGGNQAGEGHAHVFYGSASGLGCSPDWTAESNIVGAYFGYSVSDAGDVNGDGYDDVIVGAVGYDTGGLYNVGRAYVYHGSASGLNSSPNWTVAGTYQYAYLGSSVSSAGDLDGDGYDEVIIGADGKGTGSVSGLAGQAFIYSGSCIGLNSESVFALDTGQADDQYGCSVSKAGDIDGNGTADVLVGARLYDTGSLTDAGCVYLHSGICANWITFYKDFDEDGFGDPDHSFVACKKPEGYVLNRNDCNDNDDAIYPGSGCPMAMPWLHLLLE